MMKHNTEHVTLDSSIIISLLKKDIFFEEVKNLTYEIKKREIRVFISHITYAEIWVGVIASDTPKKDEQRLNKTLYELFRAEVTDLNITIARTAAAGFLKYKNQEGKREYLIPDFLIGAHALYYTNSILTTNPRDFLKYIPELEVITPDQFLKLH